jgi:hypothetical protein
MKYVFVALGICCLLVLLIAKETTYMIQFGVLSLLHFMFYFHIENKERNERTI